MADTPTAQASAQAPELLQALPLRKNFAWTLTGNLVYGGCLWGMLVAIAKLGTPAMLGQFALGFAIGGPVFIAAQLQLRAVQATDARHEYRFGHYLALRLFGTALAFAVVVAIAYLSGYRSETALVVMLIAVAKAAESLSDIIYGLWQKQERLDRIAIALMGRGVGSLIALAATLYLTGSIVLAVGAMALWWAFWLATYERGVAVRMLAATSLSERLRPAWELGALKKLAWMVLPLGPVMLFTSLNMNMPRYFVEHYHGEAALGYFAAMTYVLLIGTTVANALGQSAVPRLARSYISDRRAFARLLLKMVLLAASLGAGGILVAVVAGRPLLTLIYRADYADYAPVFAWLMLAGAVNYVASMFSFGMTAARRLRVQLPLFAAVAGANALVCWLLIPRLGLMGGAYALLTGALISCIGGGLINASALRARPRRV